MVLKSKHTSNLFLNQPSHQHRRTSSAQLLNSIVAPKTPVHSSFAPKSPQNSFIKPDNLPLLNKSPLQSSRTALRKPDQLPLLEPIPLQSIKAFTPRHQNFSILKNKNPIFSPKASTHRPDNTALLIKTPILSPTSEKNPNSPFKSFLDTKDLEGSPNYSASPTPSHRQVKFETQPQIVVTPTEKKEESEDRFKRIRKYIRQIEEIKESDRQITKEMNEDCDKVLALIDDSFLVLNISAKEIHDTVGDSAITLFAIENNFALAKLYFPIIQEISEFPYSFLSKIKLILLTVCEEVSLTNPSYIKVLNQKKNNGLFILSELTTRELIREHLYRVIMYHFIKIEPNFYHRWRENFGALNHKKGDLHDIVQTLLCIIKPTKTLKLTLPLAEQKMKIMKEELTNFDSIFFDEDWWNLKRREKQY